MPWVIGLMGLMLLLLAAVGLAAADSVPRTIFLAWVIRPWSLGLAGLGASACVFALRERRLQQHRVVGSGPPRIAAMDRLTAWMLWNLAFVMTAIAAWAAWDFATDGSDWTLGETMLVAGALLGAGALALLARFVSRRSPAA